MLKGGSSWKFDAEFKFAKIQNSHVEGVGGGLGEIDAELKCSNLLKSKIPMSGGGWGGWWNQLSTFDAESKYAKKNFLRKSFRAKMCLGIVLDFEYQVVRIYEVYANHNNLNFSSSTT